MGESMRGIILGLAWAVMTATALAGPLEDGLAAYRRGDDATGLRLLRPLADQGVPAAQLCVGITFASGSTGVRDGAEAMRLFRLAAMQGYAPAMAMLGTMYVVEMLLPQDLVQAHMWFS